MLKYFFQYKFSILLAVIIALISLLPSSSIPQSSLFSISYLDKIVHFCMYGSFSLVALLESRCSRHCLWFHFILLTAIFVLSTLIEILQATVVATRGAEWLDLAANLSGLFAGYVVFRIFLLIRS
jgi:VanZ family protein